MLAIVLIAIAGFLAIHFLLTEVLFAVLLTRVPFVEAKRSRLLVWLVQTSVVAVFAYYFAASVEREASSDLIPTNILNSTPVLCLYGIFLCMYLGWLVRVWLKAGVAGVVLPVLLVWLGPRKLVLHVNAVLAEQDE